MEYLLIPILLCKGKTFYENNNLNPSKFWSTLTCSNYKGFEYILLIKIII